MLTSRNNRLDLTKAPRLIPSLALSPTLSAKMPSKPKAMDKNRSLKLGELTNADPRVVRRAEPRATENEKNGAMVDVAVLYERFAIASV